MAAKQTGDLIPMCHPLELTGIEIQFSCDPAAGEVAIEAKVKTVGRTGVEMEAMTAVGVAALTIYDMCKAVDREMVLTDIRLMAKEGGKSGAFVRQEPTV
jgi:cyclic pyranopterin phosphate synthase